MKQKDLLADYYTLSGKASDIARQLGLAALAIVWIFKATSGTALIVPRTLVIAALLAVCALALDLLQYGWGSFWTGYVRRRAEKRRKPKDDEIRVSKYWNWPSIVCFWGKLLLVIGAYVVILGFLASKVSTDITRLAKEQDKPAAMMPDPVQASAPQ